MKNKEDPGKWRFWSVGRSVVGRKRRESEGEKEEKRGTNMCDREDRSLFYTSAQYFVKILRPRHGVDWECACYPQFNYNRDCNCETYIIFDGY